MKKTKRIIFEDADPYLYHWLLAEVLGWDERTREDVDVLEIWPEDANRTALLMQTIDTIPEEYFDDFLAIHVELRDDFDSLKICVRPEKDDEDDTLE